MTNAPKTVLAIHDLPGFGRAALSVIVPVLSTLGVQTVALPTAVLSTHTGGLGTPAKLANPGYGPAALEHYHRLGVKFDCIYSGYLADAAQAKLVEQAFELWPRAFKVVDPVLGDPLPGVGSAEQAAAQAARLTRVAPQVVVTGVTGIGGGRYIGCVGAARGGEGYAVKTPLQPRMFHGTGDIFAAVLVGRILRGNVPQAAVQAAAAFVAECIRQTPEGADERLGVWLENALPKLRQE